MSDLRASEVVASGSGLVSPDNARTAIDRAAPRDGQPLISRRGADVVLGLVGVLVVAALLEAISRGGLVSAHDVPPVSDVVGELFRLLGTTAFWDAVRHTLLAWAVGLTIAAVLGTALGLLLGSNAYVWSALRPTVEFLRPVPSVALIPLAILIWGQKLGGEVFIIAFASVWPMTIQAMYGVTQTDEVARDTARTFNFTRLETLRHVLIPSSLPLLATGLRISSAVALIVGITAEIIMGSPGLGNAITLAQSGGATVKMYALILTAGLLGVLIHVAFTFPERRFLAWHSSQRDTAGL